MMLRKRTLIIAGLGVVLVAAVSLILYFKAFSPYSPGNLLKILSAEADLEARDVLYREVGGDNVKWEISAKRARYVKKENKALFENVEAKLFLPDGRGIEFSGENGTLDTRTSNVQLSGKVSIATASGERFETDRLYYTASEKLLHTDGKVLMENSQMQVSAVGMTVSLATKEIALLSQVHARIDWRKGL